MLQVRISGEAARRVEEDAARHGATVSDLVREAIGECLDEGA